MTDPNPYSAPAGPAQPPAGVDYPGKTLGLVGLIVAIFFNIIGFIISLIAFNQSKAAGYKNGPAKAGIIVGAVLFVLGVIGTIIFVIAGAALFGGVLDMCSQLGSGTWDVNGTTYTC